MERKQANLALVGTRPLIRERLEEIAAQSRTGRLGHLKFGFLKLHINHAPENSDLFPSPLTSESLRRSPRREWLVVKGHAANLPSQTPPLQFSSSGRSAGSMEPRDKRPSGQNPHDSGGGEVNNSRSRRAQPFITPRNIWWKGKVSQIIRTGVRRATVHRRPGINHIGRSLTIVAAYLGSSRALWKSARSINSRTGAQTDNTARAIYWSWIRSRLNHRRIVVASDCMESEARMGGFQFPEEFRLLKTTLPPLLDSVSVSPRTGAGRYTFREELGTIQESSLETGQRDNPDFVVG
ncbi:hypothetical protein J6590_021009 [Homalodisca vitripennis]|nr:hypothetical protein J6590_021009 [Homalodisca vitripennis]